MSFTCRGCIASQLFYQMIYANIVPIHVSRAHSQISLNGCYKNGFYVLSKSCNIRLTPDLSFTPLIPIVDEFEKFNTASIYICRCCFRRHHITLSSVDKLTASIHRADWLPQDLVKSWSHTFTAYARVMHTEFHRGLLCFAVFDFTHILWVYFNDAWFDCPSALEVKWQMGENISNECTGRVGIYSAQSIIEAGVYLISRIVFMTRRIK